MSAEHRAPSTEHGQTCDGKKRRSCVLFEMAETESGGQGGYHTVQHLGIRGVAGSGEGDVVRYSTGQ